MEPIFNLNVITANIQFAPYCYLRSVHITGFWSGAVNNLKMLEGKVNVNPDDKKLKD